MWTILSNALREVSFERRGGRGKGVRGGGRINGARVSIASGLCSE